MDKHLKALAPKNMEAKFFKLDAENAPFFVAKLAIKTLPCDILQVMHDFIEKHEPSLEKKNCKLMPFFVDQNPANHHSFLASSMKKKRSQEY